MRNGCAAGVQDGGGTAGTVLLLLQYFSLVLLVQYCCSYSTSLTWQEPSVLLHYSTNTQRSVHTGQKLKGIV